MKLEEYLVIITCIYITIMSQQLGEKYALYMPLHHDMYLTFMQRHTWKKAYTHTYTNNFRH